MAKHDPPSERALELLHYLQDQAHYGRSYPATISDTARLIWFFIKRSRGMRTDWPIPLLEGFAGGTQLPIGSDIVAGVTSIRKAGAALLTGDVTLSEGANITLSQVGQDIQIAATPTGIGAVLFDSELAAPAATIDTGAGGIAAGYHFIVVHMQLRTTQAIVASTATMRVNNDSGANYDRQNFMVVNTTLSGTPTLAATQWAVFVAGANAQAGSATALMLTIPNYDGTVFHKSGLCTEHVADSAAASFTTGMHSMRWRNTAAISRFSVTAGSGNLDTGSRVTVLGF